MDTDTGAEGACQGWVNWRKRDICKSLDNKLKKKLEPFKEAEL